MKDRLTRKNSTKEMVCVNSSLLRIIKERAMIRTIRVSAARKKKKKKKKMELGNVKKIWMMDGSKHRWDQRFIKTY